MSKTDKFSALKSSGIWSIITLSNVGESQAGKARN